MFFHRRPFLFAFLCLLLVSILSSGWVLYQHILQLRHTITTRFDTNRWAIPARVFARPLDLYAGKEISLQQVVEELRLGRYQEQTEKKLRQGEFQRVDNRLYLKTRGFHFMDGWEPSTDCTLDFSGERLEALFDSTDARPLESCRVDPVTIGSFLPETDEDRILLSREEIPDLFIDVLLTVEDRSFYTHHGLDPKGIFRALYRNLRAGKTVAGGSTLTQQLVKNFFLSNQRTFRRKFDEAIMALLLEANYTKEEILTAYCNEIFLGQEGNRAIHGFALAARHYYGKELTQLSLAETAMLVGIIKGPSYYNPYKYPERAEQRRNTVLHALRQQGIIEEPQLRSASAEPLRVHMSTGNADHYSYASCIDLIKRRLHATYSQEDLTSQGLLIFSTLDPRMQATAHTQLRNTLDRLERDGTRLEGATAISHRHTGEILALIGGRKDSLGGFNRALDANRPIGSLVKPAVYLAALNQGYALDSTILDAAIAVTDQRGAVWQPKNYDQREHGKVMFYQALAHSLNLATVRLGLQVGLPVVASTLNRLGVEREIEPFPSLLLGAIELSPYEVLQVYQTIAASGFYTPLRSIRGVLNAQKSMIQRNPLSVEQRFSPQHTYLLQFALQEAVRTGTARKLGSMLPDISTAAGKTGTTNANRDSWFAGFTGEITAVTWVGADDNTPMGLTGATGAMVVWANTLRHLSFDRSPATIPHTIRWRRVTPPSLDQAGVNQKRSTSLPYIGTTSVGGVNSKDKESPRETENPLQKGVESVLDTLFRLFD